ncbi:MAG: GNAT family N-acetyltransferase [Limisphaerales bacterium]
METVLLRQWKDSDLESYCEMNADPEVMRHFPRLFTRLESQASFERLRKSIDENGWGLWAVEVDGAFAGFTGLTAPKFEAAFTPCVEIGWRFRREFWGRGVAYRAALEALQFGFTSLRLREVLSFTAVGNLRSRRLMERLGFVRDAAGDFDHPLIPVGHETRRHVLYRKNGNQQMLNLQAQ